MNTFYVALGLAVLWLSLSGVYHFLMIAFGLASVMIVTWLNSRLIPISSGELKWRTVWQFICYATWLAKEIVLANIYICRLIMTPSLPVSPNMIKIDVPSERTLANVIYANSITLTPGTVSVTLENSTIEVHALNLTTAKELQEGEMGRRIDNLNSQSSA